MDTLARKTINFDQADTTVGAPFLDEGSAEHTALERIVGERLASDSAELRALVLLGVSRVREALLEDQDPGSDAVVLEHVLYAGDPGGVNVGDRVIEHRGGSSRPRPTPYR